MTDPLSDMFIRIKNAQAMRKRSVVIPYSTLKGEIARVLQEAGFVEEVVRRGRKNRRVLDVTLLYDAEKRARIQGLRPVSKQSRRTYARARDLYPSRKSVDGIFIVSTSRGVLSSAAAREAKVGGEVLCEVW